MKRAREIFGRLVIFVDRPRAIPGTEERAREIASVVHLSEPDAFFGSDFKAMVQACESDWVLFLDHDEELSPEWSDPSWRTVLQTTEFTHYFCPRRWILDNQNYIAAEPWWPDPQLRLFRADVAARFPTKPHEPVAVSGEGALLRHLAIHHHVLRLTDRPARQQKAKDYDGLLPGGAQEHFYLYEDFPLPEAPVPEAVQTNGKNQILRMPRLDLADARAEIVAVEKMPGQVGRKTWFWIDVTLRNDAGMPICSAPPFPVRLAYHWRHAGTGEIAVYDGVRTEIFPGLDPSHSASIGMVVQSPPQPGTYVFHVTLVQEGNFWFEEAAGKFGREITVEVI